MRESGAAKASTVPHHMSIAICLPAFLDCLCLTCPPCVSACPFLSAAGHRGWSQTDSNLGTEVQRLCVCVVHKMEINAGVKKNKQLLRMCFVHCSLLSLLLSLHCLPSTSLSHVLLLL